MDADNASFPYILYKCGRYEECFELLLSDSSHRNTPFGALFFEALEAVRPKRLVVPDEFPSIESAIEAAGDWDTVFIRKGTYSTSLRVPKPIVLLGEERLGTVLKGRLNRNCLILCAGGYEIRNITFKRARTGILCLNVRGTIENCTFIKNGRGVHTIISAPTISNCAFYGNLEAVYFESCRSDKYFTKNYLFHRNFLAVLLMNRTEVQLVGNGFLENRIDIWASPESKRSIIEDNNHFKTKWRAYRGPTAYAPELFEPPLFRSPGPPMFDYTPVADSSAAAGGRG